MRRRKAIFLVLLLAGLAPAAADGGSRKIPLEWAPSPSLARALASPNPGLAEGQPLVSLKVALPAGSRACSVEVRQLRWGDAQAPGPIATGPEVSLGQRGVWRGIPYQEVLVRPLRVSARTGRTQIMRRLSAELVVEGGLRSPFRRKETLRLPPESLLFVNPPDAAALDAPGTSPRGDTAPVDLAPEARPEGFRIAVSKDGVYRMDYAFLTSHGFNPAGLDPRKWKMTCAGTDVPIYVEGESDGRFDVSDAVVFYGQKRPLLERPTWNGGDFTDTNAYWLVAGTAPGTRMPSVDGTPQASPQPPSAFSATVHLEVDSYMDCIDHFRPNGDVWFWGPLLFKESQGAYAIALPHLTGSTITVTSLVAGLNAGEHAIVPSLDGLPPASGPSPATWTGKSLATFTWTFPAPATGTGSLGLSVPAASDYVIPDSFDITYERTFDSVAGSLQFPAANATAQFACPGHASAPYVLDLSKMDEVTGLILPRRITGASFATGTATFRISQDLSVASRTLALSSSPLVPESMAAASGVDLSDPSLGADLLIITHPDFVTADAASAWQRYLARRRGSMQVQVALIQDVYDNFSQGVLDPLALKTFLAAAAQSWSKVPKYVLLVGDGSYDYKNVKGDTTFKNWVPTMMFEDMADSTYMGRYPSDAWYADVDGDGYPDMAVGRLPVRSLADLEGVLEKTLAYGGQPLSGAWCQTALYVSDTYTQPWEQEFETFNNTLMTTYTTAPWATAKVYFHDPPYGGTDADAAAAAIRAAWPGAGLVHYTGHSGISAWGNRAKLFTSYPSRNCGSGTCQDSDVDLLPPITASSAPLPFVLNSSCYNSAFDEVGAPCLMEALAARKDGGSIGTSGFSTIAYMGEEETFNSAVFGQLFQLPKVRTVGDLVEAGRFALSALNARSVLGSILLGDPSVVLRLPAPPPPPALAAKAGEDSVELDWTAPVPAPAGYNVYRSEDSGYTWTKANATPVAVSAYSDTGLQGAKPYAYFVVSADAAGFEGPPSPVVTATPVPSDPYSKPPRSSGFTDPPPGPSGS